MRRRARRAIAVAGRDKTPRAAASWARELADDAIAAGAVGVVASQWVARDAAGGAQLGA